MTGESSIYVQARMQLEQVLTEMRKKRPKKNPNKQRKLWWRYILNCIISLHQKASSGKRHSFSIEFINGFRGKKKFTVKFIKEK